MNNIALQIALGDGLDVWDGLCAELADAVIQYEPDADLLYIELAWSGDSGRKVRHPDNEFDWDYHVVPVINGIVHCAWYPGLMLPPEQYVHEAFGGSWTSWELNPGSDLEPHERRHPLPNTVYGYK